MINLEKEAISEYLKSEFDRNYEPNVSLLLQAASLSDLEEIKRILSIPGVMDQASIYHRALFFYCSDLNIIRYLLTIEELRNLAGKEETQLIQTVLLHGATDILEDLFTIPGVKEQADSENNMINLGVAIKQGRMGVVKLMLGVEEVKKKAGVYDNLLLRSAIEWQRLEIIKLLLAMPDVIEHLPDSRSTYKLVSTSPSEEIKSLLMPFFTVEFGPDLHGLTPEEYNVRICRIICKCPASEIDLILTEEEGSVDFSYGDHRIIKFAAEQRDLKILYCVMKHYGKTPLPVDELFIILNLRDEIRYGSDYCPQTEEIRNLICAELSSQTENQFDKEWLEFWRTQTFQSPIKRRRDFHPPPTVPMNIDTTLGRPFIPSKKIYSLSDEQRNGFNTANRWKKCCSVQ